MVVAKDLTEPEQHDINAPVMITGGMVNGQSICTGSNPGADPGCNTLFQRLDYLVGDILLHIRFVSFHGFSPWVA